MSRRKHRNRDAMVETLAEIDGRGAWLVADHKKITRTLARLEEVGAIKRVRRSCGSYFGRHIKRTFFVRA